MREKGTASAEVDLVAITPVTSARYLKEQSYPVFQPKASQGELRALPSSCYCHVLEQENTTGNKATDIRHVKNK